jgi:hypothetical protein
MRSDSYVDGIGEVPHENLLYSPAITIPRIMQNMTLSFRAKASDYIWHYEQFTVYVGDSLNHLEGKLARITTGDYLRYTVDLSDFKGDTIYIVFRHDFNDAQSSLCLDDVELYATIVPPVISKLTYYVNGEQYAQFEYEEGETITPIDGPSEVGYTFSGWQGLPEVMPANDVNVTGTFTKNIYTVTFWDSISESAISTAKIEHGEVIVEFPQLPEHEGYDFTGWDYDNSPVTSDITITALYEVKTFTVTFISGVDGTTISTSIIDYGKIVSEFPEPPTLDRFVFVDWDYDGSAVFVDITITANYLEVGDVNGDGVINTGDAVLILKGITGNSLTPQQDSLADFNNDGKVNTGDAVGILTFIISKTRGIKPKMNIS